jgi:hypothetical protein
VKVSTTLMPWESRVEGLEPSTGKVCWRCAGPGRAAVLAPGDDSNELPQVWFHTAQPTSTIYRRALPVLPSGRYGPLALTPVAYGSDPGDRWLVVPLPWVNPARQRLAQAVLPGVACLGLLGYFALRRRRAILIGLAACAVAVPLVVAALELRNWENRISHEQDFAWGGWYWIWPYALSVPAEYSVPVLVAVVVVGLLFCLPLKWRLIGFGVLVFFPALYFFASSGPMDARPWWEQSVRVPGGLTFKSPLWWMLVWLFWVFRPVLGKANALPWLRVPE